MKHTIPHDLTPALARQAGEKALESYKAKFPEYHPNAVWTGDTANVSFKVKGVSLSGRMAIVGPVIELELDVPFLFRPFQKKAIEVIEREVMEWLVKAKAGQL